MAKAKRTTVTLSVTIDTKERLREYAEQNRTSISHAVTQWIWSQSVEDSLKMADEGGI